MQKQIIPFIFLSFLCISIQSVAQTVPQSNTTNIKTGIITIPLLSGELWWGGASNDGVSMPYQEGFAYDMYDDNKGNQVQSLLICNKGRVIWSEESFKFSFLKNSIVLEARGDVLQSNAGDNLKDAFTYAFKNYFPANGKMPQIRE